MDTLHTFYISKAWRDLAYFLKIKANGKCARCGAIVVDMKNLIAHHTVELTEENVSNPEIALNEKLIEIICFGCHNKEHKRFGFNERNVYIVWGSPLSGKTTIVRELMRFGDIALDMDELWAAVTMQPKYVRANNVRFNVFALRNCLLDQIKTRYGQWRNAYVITSAIYKNEADKLADRLGGELIIVDAERSECLKRAVSDNRPHEWIDYINKWFDANGGAG